MNVTMVSHSEDGGAGIAAARLFAALKDCKSFNTTLVVREKTTWSEGVRSAKATPHSLLNAIHLASLQWGWTKKNRLLSHKVSPNLWDEGMAA